jgi:hydroxymethylbilane synthase
MQEEKKVFRLATRQSPMAMVQAEAVRDLLEKMHPNLKIELCPMKAAGDKQLNKPISKIGDKSVFVKTLEKALLNNEADFAVHCVKDMSVYSTPGLMIAAMMERDDPRDALVTRSGEKLMELPKGAKIGTGSPRRVAQLMQLRSDLEYVPIRGNVNTRLKHLKDGVVDALMLSFCGLQRIHQAQAVSELFDPDLFIPAVGQGALALQCRENDAGTQQLCRSLHHVTTALTVAAEQALIQRLNGDCQTPIGVYATLSGDQLVLRACIGDAEHTALLFSKAEGPCEQAQLIGITAADDLIAKGANALHD